VDVKTGDILALANAPTFNPNAIGEDAEPRKNHIVADAIEPGSIFKPFTIAAAVEEGIAQPEDKIDCEGGLWVIGRSRIRDDHPHGVVTLGEVMKYSSNIGVAKLAFKMGAGTFVDYLHKFGFGSETGIALPGERRGRIRDPEEIKPIELATTAFGQGTTATPIQLAMGIATIANGGVRMKPRLVTRVEDYYGVPDRVIKPAVAERAVSEETARKTREMMALVTEAGGTGTRARVPGYVVAGKTGTAQKVKDGRYSEARIGSFVGFVPADDPVIAVVVIVDEPTQGSRYGGIAAAPAFAEIAGQTLRHLGVPPDPALLAEAGEADPDPVTGDETTVEDEEESLRLAWSGDAWTMPDLTGRTRRDVLVGLQSAGLKLELSGSGSAVAQKPSPGEVLAPGSSVSVVFQ
jgi:cell division protein FtsI (penicillin-binding protein 3)